MNKKKIGIIGATGYTGVELIRLLWDHPGVSIMWLTSKTYAGQKISDVFPHLKKKCELLTEEFSIAKAEKLKLDLVFVALPHGLAQEIVPSLLEKNIKVIDLGADYRLQDVSTYEKHYVPHKSPELIKKAVYGLPEIYRDQVKKANLLANPGCYVTAATFALRPIIDKKLVKTDSIIIDAKSSISGAGRKLALTSHFNETYNNFYAYNITKHRHQPEIEQNLGVKVVFTPHVIPIDRGILVTAYADLIDKLSEAQLLNTYKEYYADEPFIKVVNHLPAVKEVAGTNDCIIALRVDDAANKVIIISVIDNLVKGASGQAVQNMNLMLGFPETQNLKHISLYP
ncbi:MAG: N-acetyl-gamma-glutamyl-phosphate reductase [Candidatus Margulisbacteria bacterium]|nr:N-acetyl-gamma-glutamyl-phosphate reductase [Candidatus Margulisiibacteriota bacterium]